MPQQEFSKRVWNFLGSRDFSVFVFIMGITYTLFLAIFATVVQVPWVSNIAKLLPFKVLYLLFFVNLVICEIKWIPVVIKRCSKPRPPEVAEDLERFRHRVQVQSSELRVQSLENCLRRKGYRLETQKIKDNNQDSSHKFSILLYADRGRFSSMGNLIFHLAFIFLFFGVIASIFFRFEGSAKVTEGYEFSGGKEEYPHIAAGSLSSLPEVHFSLEKITPRFWKDMLLFTDLRADLSYKDGRGSAWMSSYRDIGGARVTINSIGITPLYVLKDKDGRKLDESLVNLAIFAPGTEDHFKMPGFPHQIFVSFYPDYEIRDGKVVNRSMEPRNPAYFVKVFRGRLPVYSGLIKHGEEARFEGLVLSFPEYRYWGEFRIIKDPGFIFIWAAFVCFITGLSCRLLFYRREIIVVREGMGIYLYGNSDYYSTLFEGQIRQFAGMIS